MRAKALDQTAEFFFCTRHLASVQRTGLHINGTNTLLAKPGPLGLVRATGVAANGT